MPNCMPINQGLAKSAQMVQPGIEANRSCSGVEFILSKDLLALTSGAIKNTYCTNHLQYFLLFYAKFRIGQLWDICCMGNALTDRIRSCSLHRGLGGGDGAIDAVV